MYVGSNLWVSGYRARTINNLSPQTLETNPSLKTYVATPLGSHTYVGGDVITKINDSDNSRGVIFSGGTVDGKFGVIATLSDQVVLSSINYWLGQFNGGFNAPSTVDIYLGDAIDSSKLLASFSFPNLQGSIEVTNTESSNQYLLVFGNGTNNVSINEIQLLGRNSTGGEVVAV